MCRAGARMVAEAARYWGGMGVAGGAHGPCQASEHGLRVGAEDVLLHMFLAGDDEPEAAAERRDRGVMGVPDGPCVGHVGRALPGFWWGTYGGGGGQMPGWSGLPAEHMAPARPRNMDSELVPRTSSYTWSSPVMTSRRRRRNAAMGA